METKNWVLAILSVIVWFGAAGFYFKNDIKRMWRERHERSDKNW